MSKKVESPRKIYSTLHQEWVFSDDGRSSIVSAGYCWFYFEDDDDPETSPTISQYFGSYRAALIDCRRRYVTGGKCKPMRRTVV